MADLHFTNEGISALKPKAKLYEIWGDGRAGLGGAHVAERPEKPESYIAFRRSGADPGALHVDNRRAERQAESVDDITEEYLEKWPGQVNVAPARMS